MDCIDNRPHEESLLRKTALRIVKSKPGIFGMPKIEFDADFYCRKLEDVKYYYETELEFVIYVEHLELVDACIVKAEILKDEQWEIRDILCEGRHILFEEVEGKYVFYFEISGLTGKTRTLYIHTLVKEPGLTLRIEQNDPGRCAGVYRNEEYPEKQICAAQHYAFAMREMLRLLQIPQYLSQSGLGYILLLGFETNNEEHGDYPPHWHMIHRWPTYCGSQAPHIYLDNHGRMTHNLMCIDRIPHVRHDYLPEDWCSFVDMYGREIMQCKVNQDGGMSVRRENHPIYTISPYTEKGIELFCEKDNIGVIQVRNDVKNGRLEVIRNSFDSNPLSEVILYDPLNGSILEHTKQEERKQ